MCSGNELCYVFICQSAVESIAIDAAQYFEAKQFAGIRAFPLRPAGQRSRLPLQSSQYYRSVQIDVHRRRLSANNSANRSTLRLRPLIFLSDETGLFAGMILRSSASLFCGGTIRAIGCR